jgi:hypothetical protein
MPERYSIKYSKFLYTAILAFAPQFCLAQQQVSSNFLTGTPDSTSRAQPIVKTTSKPVDSERAVTARWLDLTTFSHSERYRNQYGDDGFHYFEDGQQRSLVAGKIKLDADGKYTIGFRATSGRTFNWAYADYAGRGFATSFKQSADVVDPYADGSVGDAYDADPAGVQQAQALKSAGWSFYVRDLNISAAPVKRFAFQFGSFGFERGLSTEITTFDDDGYLTGERVYLRDPHHLYFDQISVTSAYFGFFDTPNVFARGGGFTKSNYRQIAATKHLNKRVGISGEYNWISNNARTNTFREAVVVAVPESRLLDSFRLEAYEMVNRVSLQGDDERPRQGFALVGEKKIGKLSGDFGFASIDRNYGLYSGSSYLQEIGFSLNGDNYNTGIRIFSHVNYKLTPVITAFGFYTRITGQMITNLDAQGLNAGLSFDLKALANSGRKVF